MFKKAVVVVMVALALMGCDEQKAKPRYLRLPVPVTVMVGRTG